jgi:hypothetical protein
MKGQTRRGLWCDAGKRRERELELETQPANAGPCPVSYFARAAGRLRAAAASRSGKAMYCSALA